MFDLNLRQAVLQRVQNKDETQLQDIVESSIDGDEKTLPGLGVLFEVIWKNSEESQQKDMIHALQQNMPAGTTN